jgi:hypothetical protein
MIETRDRARRVLPRDVARVALPELRSCSASNRMSQRDADPTYEELEPEM